MDYEKTERYSISNIALNIFTYTEQFKQIRSKFRYKANKCHVCNKKFKIGEKISSAVTNKGNRVICNDCAKKLAENNRKIIVFDKEKE